MEKIYVWLTPKGNYYHKVVRGPYKYNTVGDINQYKHKLVHIIELDHFLTSRKYKVNYRRMLIDDTIRLLNKIR